MYLNMYCEWIQFETEELSLTLLATVWENNLALEPLFSKLYTLVFVE